MLVTWETSQDDKSWLNELFLRNKKAMSVTLETSQDDKSWLKDLAALNIVLMSVTSETSHDSIGPFGPFEHAPIGDWAKHALTAFSSSALDCGANVAPKNEIK